MKERRKTCLQCDKPIVQTEGRRERKFCPDSNCGQLYWLSTHPKENRFKRIPIEEYQKLMSGAKYEYPIGNEGRKLSTKLPLNKESEEMIKESSIVNSISVTPPDKSEIEKQIAEYPKDFNSLLTLAKNGVEDKEGFKSWVKKRGLPPNQQSLIISKI